MQKFPKETLVFGCGLVVVVPMHDDDGFLLYDGESNNGE